RFRGGAYIERGLQHHGSLVLGEVNFSTVGVFARAAIRRIFDDAHDLKLRVVLHEVMGVVTYGATRVSEKMLREVAVYDAHRRHVFQILPSVAIFVVEIAP